MDDSNYNSSYSSESEVSCSKSTHSEEMEDIPCTDITIEKYQMIQEQLEQERSISASLRKELSHLTESSKRISCAKSDESDDDMKRKLCEASMKLVLEGEKKINMALQVEKDTNKVSALKQEVEKFRCALLHGINGGINDTENYLHVSLEELLRIRLQESDGEMASEENNVKMTSLVQYDSIDNNNTISGKVDNTNNNPISGIQKVEKKLCLTQQKNFNLKVKCEELEEKVEIAKEKSNEINILQQKISKLVERSRNDQKTRKNMEYEQSESSKRIQVLSDHIEKLMMYLKHEVTAKVRSITELSQVQKKFLLSNSQFQTLEKQKILKDQHISKLNHEGTILEEQLRLMDEKYMELRMRLDWTRSQMEKMIRKKEEEIQQLKDKIALCGTLNTMTDRRKEIGSLSTYEFKRPGKRISKKES